MNYFEIDRISNSRLKPLEISIQQFLNEDFRPTKATVLGNAVHEAVLEPKLFNKKEEYKNATVNDDFVKNFKETHYLKEQKEQAKKIKEALKKHPTGKSIFQKAEKEKVILFEHEGVECKSKLDWVNPKKKLIKDLKTISDITEYERAITNFKYYRQAVFYQYACFYEYGELFDFEFVFVSTDPKKEIEVVVMELHSDWFQIASDEITELLNKYKAYKTGFDKNIYYKPEKVIMQVPSWKQKSLV